MSKISTVVMKIMRLLTSAANEKLDSDIAIWVGRYKLKFELEHRYGGDLRLEVTILDELTVDNTGVWSNVDYVGMWTDEVWTFSPSKLAAFVEKAIMAAYGEL